MNRFDPAVHLAFDPREIERVRMSEIGLDPSIAPTDFAFSKPFRLLSPEGVERTRAELVTKDVQQNCRFRSKRNPYALRGVWKYSPFLNELWKSREIKDALSRVADFPLILNPLDWELGHVNVHLGSDVAHPFNPPYAITRDVESALAPEHVRSPASTFDSRFSTEHYEGGFDAKDTKELADEESYDDFWHVDDYPFVCIVMLSDPRAFRGGETVMRNNEGGHVKLQYPDAGYAILCQGRYVIHGGLRAFGAAERICMIPSFLPEHPMAEDTTALDSAKCNSDHRELFEQWSSYRLERFHAKVALQKQALRERIERGTFDRDETLAMIDELVADLKRTRDEMSWP